MQILPSVKLLLFDFDETLAQSEGVRLSIRNVFLKEIGAREMSHQEYQDNCVGRSLKLSIAPWLKASRPEISLSIDELADELKKREREMYKIGNIIPKPFVVEFLDIITKKHPSLKKAVCTGADREDIKAKLRSAGLLDYFSEEEMFSRGEAGGFFKPHPAMYLAAFAPYRKKIAAKEVRVFEDNQEGVLAGISGGFPTIAMPSEWSKNHDFGGAILAPNGFMDILEFDQYYLGLKL